MAESKDKQTNFEENFKKLEALAQELQGNKVSVDQLVPRMKQALASIKVCKDVLKETRSQLNEIGKEFSDLEAMGGEAPPES